MQYIKERLMAGQLLRLLGLAVAVVSLAIIITLLSPLVAHAATTDEPVEPGVTFDIPWLWVVGAVTTVLMPIITGLVTNSNWSSRAKGILHLGLSAISGFLVELTHWLQDGGVFNIGLALAAMIVTFIAGVGVYLGLMKPVGSSGESLAQVLARTGNTGRNSMGGR